MVNLCPGERARIWKHNRHVSRGLSPHIADLGVLAGVKPWHSPFWVVEGGHKAAPETVLSQGICVLPSLLVRTPGESHSQVVYGGNRCRRMNTDHIPSLSNVPVTIVSGESDLPSHLYKLVPCKATEC